MHNPSSCKHCFSSLSSIMHHSYYMLYIIIAGWQCSIFPMPASSHTHMNVLYFHITKAEISLGVSNFHFCFNIMGPHSYMCSIFDMLLYNV